jgi:hypothetical protein
MGRMAFVTLLAEVASCRFLFVSEVYCLCVLKPRREGTHEVKPKLRSDVYFSTYPDECNALDRTYSYNRDG